MIPHQIAETTFQPLHQIIWLLAMATAMTNFGGGRGRHSVIPTPAHERKHRRDPAFFFRPLQTPGSSELKKKARPRPNGAPPTMQWPCLRVSAGREAGHLRGSAAARWCWPSARRPWPLRPPPQWRSLPAARSESRSPWLVKGAGVPTGAKNSTQKD